MEIIIYLCKVNIAIAIFCLVYRAFYRKDTFFSIRRYLLQCILLLSVLYPFMDFSFWMVGNKTMMDFAMSYKSMMPEIVIYFSDSGAPATEPSTTALFSLLAYFSWFYIVVTCFLLLRILVRAMQIIWLRFRSESIFIEEASVFKLDIEATPFSFFSWIFINPGMHNEKELHEVLVHEMVHVRQCHSIDILAVEFICAFCWINPFVWMLKKEIRKNLEFLADNCVINKGDIDIKSYQYNLLKLAYHPSNLTLANQFNVSPLKERIMMINVKKSPKIRLIAYTLIFPLALLFLIVNSIGAVADRVGNNKIGLTLDTRKLPLNIISFERLDKSIEVENVKVVDYRKINNSDESLQRNTSEEQPLNSNDNQEKFVFLSVEKMPEFPGGDVALLKWINENLNYPTIAAENGVQGRVSCTFVVQADGSVSDAEVVRPLDTNLDKEAVRVLSTLPKFIPGEQRGKKVAVKYSVPVRFQLKN